MRITGTQSTIGAMDIASGVLAIGIVKALRDGIDRAALLRDVDRAHSIGQQRYVAIIKRKKQAMRADAVDGAAMLNAARKRLNG